MCSSDLDNINGLKLPIISGTIHRDEEGKIAASVRVASAIPMMKELRAALGDDEWHLFFSVDEYISHEVTHPTVFRNFSDRTVQPGTQIHLPGLARISHTM